MQRRSDEQIRKEFLISITDAIETGDMRKLGRIYKRACDLDKTNIYYEIVKDVKDKEKEAEGNIENDEQAE